MADLAMLGLALAATGAVCTASAMVVRGAVQFGRHMQLFDATVTQVGAIASKVEIIDEKVERHLQFHEETRPAFTRKESLG